MKANLPPVPPPPPEPAAPAAPSEPAPRRWGRFAALALVVLLGAGWWFYSRPKELPPPADPPLPPGITDTDVATVIERARARVLANKRSGADWGEYGTVLLAHLFDREAEQCFVVASELDPADPRWPYARGHIALKRDPERAIALLTTAAEAARENREFRTACALTLAEAHLERGETDRAAELFRLELDAAPGEERALFGLGTVAALRGESGPAEGYFLKVRRHPCCRQQAAAQLARLARARGDLSAAKQYESEAATLEPDPPWPDPYLDRVVTLQVGARGIDRRAALLERDGLFDEAALLYLAEAEKRPTSKLLTGAAVNLARRRDYDRAVELLRRAVALDPNDPNARYTLALVLYTRAERLWVENPASAEAAALFREVAAEAKRATELKPDHASAYLFWGLALKNTGDPRGAIEPLQKGLVVRPGLFELHLSLGQVLVATGDRPGAVRAFEAAKALKPEDPRPGQELEKLE